MAEQEWQPIETAPRDGRRLKLLIPYDPTMFTEEECTTYGHWEPIIDKRHWSPPQWAQEEGGHFRFDDDDGPFDIQPTHWQPIPHSTAA